MNCLHIKSYFKRANNSGDTDHFVKGLFWKLKTLEITDEESMETDRDLAFGANVLRISYFPTNLMN